MDINKELSKLEGKQRVELEEWIAEHIYKLVKINNNNKLNYVPFVERKQVVWVDFGINIGQELNYSHPAVVLYSKANGGTALVAPLTSKKNECNEVIDIGNIENFEKYSYCKIDQIRAISKLRIQTKKHNGKYYNNFNSKTGIYSNPKLTTDQMNIIDDAIKSLKNGLK